MSGENRAWAVAEAPSGSTTGFPAPPEALTWVGSAVPLAPRSVPFGIPRTVHALAEVFLTVSAYAIWPAPALFGIMANVAARSVPRQGLADFTDPVHRIPVYSLYGEVRRPTAAMMESFDVLLVDLQDLGCRIYTFMTTLRYMLEAAAAHAKEVWVLDRPNPAGRPVEGTKLRAGWESFVGAGPLPMRHGLTLGELARWFIQALKLDVQCEVVTMEGWKPGAGPGYGWPLGERVWVNPSPNAPNLWMARCYAGTVMLEGTTLSEGRGTTRPLELFGAPDLNPKEVLTRMSSLAPEWMQGCALRECWFEPTFHKHSGKLCAGIQLHVEGPAYRHAAFRPWRLMALAFKALRGLRPDYELWRDFPYEYEKRLPIDVINGAELLRQWVDDPAATSADLDEAAWLKEREPLLLYR